MLAQALICFDQRPEVFAQFRECRLNRYDSLFDGLDIHGEIPPCVW